MGGVGADGGPFITGSGRGGGPAAGPISSFLES